jgi:hypothetical protein
MVCLRGHIDAPAMDWFRRHNPSTPWLGGERQSVGFSDIARGHIVSAASDPVIRQIQEYLGHAHVETTMIYRHVVKELRMAARSPLDILASRSPDSNS